MSSSSFALKRNEERPHKIGLDYAIPYPGSYIPFRQSAKNKVSLMDDSRKKEVQCLKVSSFSSMKKL